MAKTYSREDIEAVAARNLFYTCLVNNFMFQLDVRVLTRKADEAWSVCEAHHEKFNEQMPLDEKHRHFIEDRRLFKAWQRQSDQLHKLYKDRNAKREQDSETVDVSEGAHCEKGALSE